jgi:hypothetical protein
MPSNNTTKRSANFKNRTGQRYGRLVVLEEATPPANARPYISYWLCRCDCGAVVTKNVTLLRPNKSNISCGCLRKEQITELGHSTRKHGMKNTPEYITWTSMKARCYNPKTKGFKYYGGRGIAICARWRESFEAFYQDMGPRPSSKHSIDRIDNNGPYSPDNCRWATRYEQIHNQRKRQGSSNVRLITYNGKTQSVAAWSRELGFNYGRIITRLHLGWDVERAFTT